MRRYVIAMILLTGFGGCMPTSGGPQEDYDAVTGERKQSTRLSWEIQDRREPSKNDIRPDMPAYGEK